jgi:hypothetical protein
MMDTGTLGDMCGARFVTRVQIRVGNHGTYGFRPMMIDNLESQR